MSHPFIRFALLIVLTIPCAWAQTPKAPPDIHMVVMGGNDCPPCVAWRALELPKLRSAQEFTAIRYSYVVKAIRSPVPSAFFLPETVQPLQSKLMTASNGLSGSPHAAILVDGEVFDYYFGTRSAEEIIAMLTAIRTGAKYPFERCLKLGTSAKSCGLKGKD